MDKLRVESWCVIADEQGGGGLQTVWKIEMWSLCGMS